MALQEAIADVYGFLMTISEAWLRRSPASAASRCAATHIAEMLHYLRRGPEVLRRPRRRLRRTQLPRRERLRRDRRAPAGSSWNEEDFCRGMAALAERPHRGDRRRPRRDRLRSLPRALRLADRDRRDAHLRMRCARSSPTCRRQSPSTGPATSRQLRTFPSQPKLSGWASERRGRPAGGLPDTQARSASGRPTGRPHPPSPKRRPTARRRTGRSSGAGPRAARSSAPSRAGRGRGRCRGGAAGVVDRQRLEDDLRARLGHLDHGLRQFQQGELVRVADVDRRCARRTRRGRRCRGSGRRRNRSCGSGSPSPKTVSGRSCERLAQEGRDRAPVVGAHPRAVGVEDAHDRGVDALLAVVGHRQRLGVALRLVVDAARADRVDVAPVVLASAGGPWGRRRPRWSRRSGSGRA